MVTSDGRSVMRNRMFLYSISEGAGLMSFCFIVMFSLFLSSHKVTHPAGTHVTRVRERCHGPSQSNRQTVTLFPHNTRQFRYFSLERVQLYNENHPHGCRFQPLARIRTRINKSSECGMELKEIMRKT